MKLIISYINDISIKEEYLTISIFLTLNLPKIKCKIIILKKNSSFISNYIKNYLK